MKRNQVSFISWNLLSSPKQLTIIHVVACVYIYKRRILKIHNTNESLVSIKETIYDEEVTNLMALTVVVCCNGVARNMQIV